MSVSLILDGDPDGCHAAAASLRALATELDDAGTVTASIRTRSEGDWNSRAGELLRNVCTRHLASGDRLRGASRELALQLSALASALAEARSELDRARKVARSGGYNVDTALPSFDQVLPEGRAETTLDHALAIAARAREVEAHAHAAFTEAVGPILEALTPPAEPAHSEPGTSQSILGRLRDLLPGEELRDLSPLVRLVDEARDLDLLDRLGGLDATDGLRAGGALAGVALCTRAKLPPSLLAACADGGGQLGGWAGDRLTGGSDEQ